MRIAIALRRNSRCCGGRNRTDQALTSHLPPSTPESWNGQRSLVDGQRASDADGASSSSMCSALDDRAACRWHPRGGRLADRWSGTRCDRRRSACCGGDDGILADQHATAVRDVVSSPCSDDARKARSEAAERIDAVTYRIGRETYEPVAANEKIISAYSIVPTVQPPRGGGGSCRWCDDEREALWGLHRRAIA